ncbi:MAG: ABC transporter ATP-binding protein [Clostridiales Family XIII bacterium]|nr:ABC transporter ATP-binding protein [Clostridiales Family XIII bacterium]
MCVVLQLIHLVKTYQSFRAVDDISLDLTKGEFLTLLGPSGSGKTTTLKMVAGLEIPSEGEIYVNGENITPLPPNKRGLGMVFQNYALFPHMTVKENIAFPLKMKRAHKKEEIAAKVDEMLELIRLDGYQERYPSQLSGGQQQRIALARAMVFHPPIVLMDEPLGALDKKLRAVMQFEIKRIQKKMNITTIYVTHDQEEALTMSDRIAIMNNGKIEQLGSPKEIYEHPANAFVADFIGESNFLPVEAKRRADGGQYLLTVKSQIASVIPFKSSSDLPQMADAKLFVRPEKTIINPGAEIGGARVTGRITDAVYLGEMIRYVLRIDEQFEFIVKQQTSDSNETLPVGSTVALGWPDECACLL